MPFSLQANHPVDQKIWLQVIASFVFALSLPRFCKAVTNGSNILGCIKNTSASSNLATEILSLRTRLSKDGSLRSSATCLIAFATKSDWQQTSSQIPPPDFFTSTWPCFDHECGQAIIMYVRYNSLLGPLVPFQEFRHLPLKASNFFVNFLPTNAVFSAG